MDEIRECPRCHGVAAMDYLARLHWCATCKDYTERISVILAANKDHYYNPALKVPHDVQRTLYRLLTWLGALLGKKG